jgi:hypothetical protein
MNIKKQQKVGFFNEYVGTVLRWDFRGIDASQESLMEKWEALGFHVVNDGGSPSQARVKLVK